MYKDHFISVILLAGGQGKRLESLIPKQFLSLGGKLLVLYSYEFFDSLSFIDEIIIVCDPDYRHHFKGRKKISFALPGKERQDSLFSALKKVDDDSDYVCIHDAARPFLEKIVVEKVIEAGICFQAAAVGIPEKNTLKIVDDHHFVTKTLPRKDLFSIQTPQVIKTSLLQEIAKKPSIPRVTDDVALLEENHFPVKIVLGSEKNFKITTSFDWLIANTLVSS
ncbi:MAG: 2-C-methyl-D-erythritol 4-phosphate cytidylyltransferase [Parachlamydiales bacterium]|nr:2-C-methyl-D-erythritol 4-phosphate cytidylyltransferase [Parachlamydiales bacterium]